MELSKLNLNFLKNLNFSEWSKTKISAKKKT